MIQCSACNTLNPRGQATCLACGTSLAGASDAAGTAATTEMARCPAGHPIDPSWQSCPYCTRGETASGASRPARATRLEDTVATPGEPPRAPAKGTRLEEGAAVPPPLPDTVKIPPSGAPKPTRLEEPDPPPRQRTVLADSEAEVHPPSPPPPPPSSVPHAAPPRRDTRRLVAVLAAPGTGPGGAVFPVREGKNLIGSDPRSEIRLDGDAKVSGEHALLLHRGGTFYLADRMSTNGTWVNGEEIDGTAPVTLADRDRIRCGETEMLFLNITDDRG